MKRIEVRILAVACLLTLCSFANAASVLWPATWVGPGGSLADYFIAGGDGNNGTTAGIYVNIFDDGNNPALLSESFVLDPGTIWFATSAGTPINATTTAGAQAFLDSYKGTFGTINLQYGQPFYLGFYVDKMLSNKPFTGAAIYGWAELSYDGTTLSLLDNAAETTGVGIYAGTYTPIPEPCSAGLALAGLATLAIRRKWRKPPVANG